MNLNITDMELFAPNTMRVFWTAQKFGAVTIDRYTITLVLSRDGVSEQVRGTAAGGATSASIDLSSISADNRAKLFGPNLKVTAILKADCTGRTSKGVQKFAQEIQKSKKFTATETNSIAK